MQLSEPEEVELMTAIIEEPENGGHALSHQWQLMQVAFPGSRTSQYGDTDEVYSFSIASAASRRN